MNAIKDWFEEKLNDTQDPIILKKGALKYPITINEVRKARKKLKNTTGPDVVQNELLKINSLPLQERRRRIKKIKHKKK